MRKVCLNEFRNGDSRFVAYGLKETFRQVYSVGANGHLKLPGMLFPSCIRFMPYADVKDEVEMTMTQVTDKFGPAIRVGEVQTIEGGGR